MASIVQCTQCGAQYTATEQQVGTWAHCAACGTTFLIAAVQPTPTLYVEPVPPSPQGVSALPPGPSGALPPPEGMPAAYAVPYAGQAQGTGRATAALVLGIVSLPGAMVMCAGPICGILAIVFGQSAKNAIRRGQMPASARGQAQAGVICGSIGTALSVIMVILFSVLMFTSVQATRAMVGGSRPLMPMSGTTLTGSTPTGLIICDDGAKVPAAYLTPLIGPDGTPDPYRYSVPGHGVGYREYRCLQTGQTWPYGKNGQTTSPFIHAPSTPAPQGHAPEDL